MPDDVTRAISVHLAVAHDQAQRRADGRIGSLWSVVATQIALLAMLLGVTHDPADPTPATEVGEELKQALRILTGPHASSRWDLADRVTARRWLSEIVDSVGEIDG